MEIMKAIVSSYATSTVLGETKWAKTWALRVPRRLQEPQIEVAKARDKLTALLGRSHTVQELADSDSDSAFEEVLHTIQSQDAPRTRSLDGPTGEDFTLADSLGIRDPDLARAEMRLLLDETMDVLSDRHQEVLCQRLEEDLTRRRSPGASWSPRYRSRGSSAAAWARCPRISSASRPSARKREGSYGRC